MCLTRNRWPTCSRARPRTSSRAAAASSPSGRRRAICWTCVPTLRRIWTAATIDDWDPAQYKALFSRDGRQFGLPKYHGALALYYNKDIFDKYRVDYPTAAWNHNDYLAAMKRLTHDRDGDGRTDLWGSMLDVSWERIQVHVNGWGGHFVDPGDPTRSRMADPPALAALEWSASACGTTR